jgi:hypothetical protein
VQVRDRPSSDATDTEATLTTVLRRCAELDVDRRFTELGARLTPAMAKLARPLLIELLATRTPATVQLQLDPTKPPADGVLEISIADRILQILAAAPSVDALTTGRLADADPAVPATNTLTPDREAELEQKYRFRTSWGFRRNN